ncbi:MAG: AMP-binding protein [Acidobacteria bacterium]|nr:AMP-binding protein [Acidobacteriota bacterium]MBI3654898.1 AMP-binding protein [Acidobacteriota bacterium]
MGHRTLHDYLNGFYNLGSQVAYTHRRGYRLARHSYRFMADAAWQFARELDARHIDRGECVMIWGENCAEWVIAFWGCILRGVIVVPMDQIASVDFARRVCRQVNARLLVCRRGLAPPDLGLPTMILEELIPTLSHYPTESGAPVDSHLEDTVEIVFTSGTTADPKGVVITQRNILANLEPLETEIAHYRKYERIIHPLRFLIMLPLSHVFGQLLGIFIPPLLGGTVIFQDSLNPSEIIRTIKRSRVSVMVTVPRLLQSLREKVERDYAAAERLEVFRKDLVDATHEHFVKRWCRFRRVHNQFGWKFWAFVCGGATLDANTEAFWGRLSFVVIQGYGLTETTSLISVSHPFQVEKGSIGKVLPGREITLSEDGEILVRGESITSGYWHGQELKPVLGQEGWFHTGDIGEMDKAGNLFFKGRKKNVIVTSAGMNIYPEDLEAALRLQPGIKDVVVIGLAGEGKVEPCAVLVLRAGETDAKRLVESANQTLAGYQQIRRWYVWPEYDFPRTSTQKPRMNVIQEFVEQQVAGARGTLPNRNPLTELIGHLRGRSPQAVSATDNLATDLNLSSIDRVELLSAIEERYQMDLNETIFSAATTVGDLEKILAQPPPRRAEHAYPRWTQRRIMDWLRVVVYYLLIGPAMALLARPRIIGRHRLRGVRGPVLVIANHITSLDIGFLMAALPHRLRHRLCVAMDGELLWSMRRPPAVMNFFVRGLNKLNYALAVSLFNVFPLPQQTGFRESFIFAGESIDRGYNMVVFPEGQRSPDGRMAPFRAGIGLLAKNLNIPIVPMRIDGLFELKQAGKRIAPRRAITVTVGAPITVNEAAEASAITQELENIVATLG